MSYHTPSGWRDRCTFLGDNEGPHQIRILGQLHFVVACACDIRRPLGVITTAEEALERSTASTNSSLWSVPRDRPPD